MVSTSDQVFNGIKFIGHSDPVLFRKKYNRATKVCVNTTSLQTETSDVDVYWGNISPRPLSPTKWFFIISLYFSGEPRNPG